MRTISIIPARGGSKGIPHKNLMTFAGRPLLDWTVLQSLAAECVDVTIVSSDDEAILARAESLGAVGLRRPEAISGDLASSESAVLHALNAAENGAPGLEAAAVDLVVFLQATCPLRRPGDIDAAAALVTGGQADSVFSSVPLESFFLWRREPDGLLTSVNYDYHRRQRRQDMPEQFRENGSIFVMRPEVLRRENNRLGGRIATSVMEPWQAYDIDAIEDVEICEHYFIRKLLK